MTRVALRLLAATVAACVALLLGAAPAFAHTRLESSDPADKSSVDTAPESVSLTFNEDISAEFASISVVGPDGTNYATGPVSFASTNATRASTPAFTSSSFPSRISELSTTRIGVDVGIEGSHARRQSFGSVSCNATLLLR